MANENLTEAWLLNVPLENDYKNTLYFTSKDEQVEYFKSRKVFYFNDFSYQRKDEPVRVPGVDSQGLVSQYDNLINAGINYVMYRNTTKSTKWYFAFITDIKFISEGITEIYLETDVIQTWFFNYRVKSSFVEREHVSDDTIGKHTVPENIETGEFVCNSHTTDTSLDELFRDLTYILASTLKTTSDSEGNLLPAGGRVYNGIYGGVKYYRFDQSEVLNEVIKLFQNKGQVDGIVGLFMVPKFLAPVETDGALTYTEVLASGSAQNYVVTLDKNTMLNGYAPKNKKLLTSAYNYLVVSNNNGGNAIYDYEHFEDPDGEDQIYFKVEGALCPGGSIRMIPLHYKGAAENDDEGINLGKFPICSFAVDMYINWLTQNSINVAGLNINSDQMNIGANALSSALQIVGGIGLMATGGGMLAGGTMVASGIAGGITGVSNAVMQQKQHQLTPPQARGNTNCGDVITSSNKNTFHFYKMSIKEEYARICDNFMHMFGYRVNRVKIPNKCHRSRFWYTKTIDVNIDGAIPNKDMQIIKNCYNNGITFWRNANEIQNYALDNAIAITEGAITD